MALNIVEKAINKSDLEPGMFIKFGYTKADGSSGDYSILVVDPYRTSERARSPQLHGYNVDGVSDEDVISFLFDSEASVEIDVDNNEVTLGPLSSQSAYDTLEAITTIDRPYRIFTLDNVGSISRVTIQLPNDISVSIPNNVTVISSTSKTTLLEILIDEDYGLLKTIDEVKRSL